MANRPVNTLLIRQVVDGGGSALPNVPLFGAASRNDLPIHGAAASWATALHYSLDFLISNDLNGIVTRSASPSGAPVVVDIRVVVMRGTN